MITQNPLGLPGAQNVKIWMARDLVGLQSAPAQIGSVCAEGYEVRSASRVASSLRVAGCGCEP